VTNESPIHMHCRNYAPIDVVKGICHVTKAVVHADDMACSSFDRLPRCVECALYAPGEEGHLGLCTATPDQPMTYPELAAVTCEWFQWRDR
jgi:4-hydroxyphenylacetate decarboxylase small subunit